MNWLAHALEIVKSPKLVVWVAITSALLLFIPGSWLPGDFIAKFREQYGVFVVFAFSASIAMLVIEISLAYWRHRQAAARLVQRLISLDEKEKAILREFTIQGRNTIKLPILHPVVAGLFRDGVLVLVQSLPETCAAGLLGSCVISPTAKCRGLPELLGFPPDGLTEENERIIVAARPHFALEITRKEEVWQW